jgi:hypothetical protein
MAGKGISRAESPVVAVAHERQDGTGIVTMSSGVRVRLHPVSSALVTKVMMEIKEPVVPNWWNAEKERDEPNPSDPAYLRAVQAAENERGINALDAMLLFGVELVDLMPEDTTWLKRLAVIKINVDQEDPIAMELAYKRYVVVLTQKDIRLVTEAAGISEESVAKAEAAFPGNN